MNFWQQLNKPFFCLAPMEEVTDVVCREMFARYSKRRNVGMSENQINRISDFSDSSDNSELSDFVMFTEFVNVDGLLHPEGFKKLSIDLQFTERQRPMVAQLWGRTPEKFEQAASLVAKMGFDGVDINMGCPQSKEIGIGACAALIREPALAKEIIEATKKGAGGLPVSVKTRLGYTKVEEMEGWVTALLETGIAALTLHGRTKQEMSKVPAHWNRIRDAVIVRDNMFPAGNLRPLIIGNGDVKSYQEGLDRVAETNVDGVMVGRGAFGYPWFFRGDGHVPSVKERLEVMIEHAQMFNEKLGGIKSFVIMRKHFKAYVSGFDGAHELRAKLMETKNLDETRTIVEEYLKEIK